MNDHTLAQREQSRTLRLDRSPEIEPRLSRADEQKISDAVRAREDQAKRDSVDADLEHIAFLGRELEALRTSLRERHAMTRGIYRDLDTIRRTLTSLRGATP